MSLLVFFYSTINGARGTAIVLFDSVLRVGGKVEFSNNVGYRGGAVYVDYDSSVRLI